MKNRLLTLAGTLALLAVLGKFYAKPLMAQARAALVQDVDQAARAPFQANVPININNFNYTNVPIPTGKRLVIDHINLEGAAQTTGPNTYVQPIIVASVGVAGNPSVTNYYAATQSGTAPGQYYTDFPTTVYADSLSLAPAFAGYNPSFMSFSVVITGHLITP